MRVPLDGARTMILAGQLVEQLLERSELDILNIRRCSESRENVRAQYSGIAAPSAERDALRLSVVHEGVDCFAQRATSWTTSELRALSIVADAIDVCAFPTLGYFLR